MALSSRPYASRADAETRARALGEAERAKAALAGLPDGPVKVALAGLADFVVARVA
jgi:hypothetical protein